MFLIFVLLVWSNCFASLFSAPPAPPPSRNAGNDQVLVKAPESQVGVAPLPQSAGGPAPMAAGPSSQVDSPVQKPIPNKVSASNKDVVTNGKPVADKQATANKVSEPLPPDTDAAPKIKPVDSKTVKNDVVAKTDEKTPAAAPKTAAEPAPAKTTPSSPAAQTKPKSEDVKAPPDLPPKKPDIVDENTKEKFDGINVPQDGDDDNLGEAGDDNDRKGAEVERNQLPEPIMPQNMADDNKHKLGDNHSDEPESSHFLTYLLVAAALCAAVYLIAHNRQKIIGLIVEGRRGGEARNGRVRYRRLKANEIDDEVKLMSKEGGNVIY